MSDETREEAARAVASVCRLACIEDAEAIVDAIMAHVRDDIANRLDGRLDHLSVALGRVDDRAEKLADSLGAHTIHLSSDLGSVEGHAAQQRQALAARLSTIEARLAEHLHDVRDELSGRKERDTISKRIDSLRSDLDRVAGDMSARMDRLEARVHHLYDLRDERLQAEQDAEDAASEPDAPTPDSGLGREPLVLKSDADARIAELRAENARLRQGRDRSLEIELREQKDAALAEVDRLKAERGPVMAYKGRDGDVWSQVPYMDKWSAPGMGVRTLNQIARKFGPLVALHEGEPLEWDGEGEGDG